MHTWDEIDSQTVSWNNKINTKKKVDKKLRKKILELYHPKSYRIAKQIAKDEIVVTSDFITDRSTSLNGMNFMFESLNCANTLRKEFEIITNSKYDLIVATRPDIAILNPLPKFEDVNKEAKAIGLDLENTRFFCGLSSTSKANVTLMCHRGCDMLFWGKPNAIDTFVEANLNLTKENIKSSFFNVSTIYAANEIRNGNNPQQICFAFGKDWKNIRFDDPLLKEKEYIRKEKSKLYKFLHFYWLRGKKNGKK